MQLKQQMPWAVSMLSVGPWFGSGDTSMTIPSFNPTATRVAPSQIPFNSPHNAARRRPNPRLPPRSSRAQAQVARERIQRSSSGTCGRQGDPQGCLPPWGLEPSRSSCSSEGE
jgi:hypothetical protein